MTRRLLPLALLSAWCVLHAAGCAERRSEPPHGVLTVSREQAASWVRNFNPLSTVSTARWPTLAGVYEPLFVWNGVQGEYVPWLGTSFAWSEGATRLRVQVRKGVQWSDGTPMTARDVVFTFELLRRYPALDRRGVWSFLAGVREAADGAVDFELTRPFLPGFDEIAPQPIVPEHVFSRVADPLAFTNETPVGTGPFTEVRVFRDQVYELGRNPHYWRPGEPAVEALRFPAYPNNDRANLALVFDEADWVGNFVPAIDRVFVARDPAHHGYWFPLTGSTVFLYANTARAPFDDVRVRKALSMAIDRAAIVRLALFDYSRPADATALSDAHARWRDPGVVAGGDWVRHDAARASALLDEAGLLRGPDGLRHTRDGAKLHHELLVVAGWSDWVRAAQVIARDLRAVGVDVSVRALDFGAWFERMQRGDLDLGIGWSTEGPTPWVFYRWLMSPDTVTPLGKAAVGNWHRYGSRRAAPLFSEFERAADPDERRRIVRELEQVFSDEAPAIPLFPNPSWAAFNTQRFEGFPTAQDPYADPSPNKEDRGETLLVLTHLRPRSPR